MTVTRFCKNGHDKQEVGKTTDGSCKACKRAARSAHYVANREKERVATRTWKASNTEKVLARQRAWIAANREKVQAQRRAWSAANPEKQRATERAWAAANLGKSAAYESRRRARKASNGVGLTPAYDYAAIVNGATRCGICHRRYKKGDARALDHIISISQGGPDSRENVQSAHATCNSRKRDRIPTGTQFPLGMGVAS